MPLPGFAGGISSCTQYSRRAAPLDPSLVMQSCAARLNARLTKQSVNCELLCIIQAISDDTLRTDEANEKHSVASVSHDQRVQAVLSAFRERFLTRSSVSRLNYSVDFYTSGHKTAL